MRKFTINVEICLNKKRDLLKHIKEANGQEICHRYLGNKCTVRRCIFSHNVSNAPNVDRTSQGRVAQVPTQAYFHSLPTAGPVVWSRVVAKGTKPPTVHKLSEEAQNEIRNMTTHMIETQIKDMLPKILATVTAALNLPPQ